MVTHFLNDITLPVVSCLSQKSTTASPQIEIKNKDSPIFTSIHRVVSWILNNPDLSLWIHHRLPKRPSNIRGQVPNGGLLLCL